MTMTENGQTTREQIEAKKAEIDAAQAQLDALGDRVTAEDQARALGVAEDLANLLNTYKAETKVAGVQGEAAKLLEELSGAPVNTIDPNDAKAAASGVNNPKGMTFGQFFVESDMYKEFQSRNVVNGEVKGIGGNTPSVAFGVGMPEVQALSTGGSDTSGGAFIEPYHMPGHVDNAEFREFTLWDLCTKIPVTTDTFDYVEVDSKTNNAAPVAEATSAGGLASAGHPDAVTDLAGGLKPESNFTTVKRTVTLEQIAHLHYITRKAAAHAPQLMAIANQFMGEGVEEETEDQLILGDGTSPNLRGLLNATNPYALNTFDMSDNGETQRIRAIAKAAGIVRTQSRRRPTAMLVHPNDWFSDSFLLEQDGNGNYKVGDPRATLEQLNSLWGLRVVVSEAVPEGTQVVGDFAQMQIGHTGQIMMYMSDSNRDLFERNILTLLAERMAGVGVLKPKAFCTVVA